jgi:hypothetical protein
MKFIILSLFVFCGLYASRAALPDSEVQKNMQESPEILDIFVLRTDALPSKESPDYQALEVFAQVIKVGKTASNLKPGSKIRIAYSVPSPGSIPPPGTFATLVPKVGQQLVAYLSSGKIPNVYEPTPGTYGFEQKTP